MHTCRYTPLHTAADNRSLELAVEVVAAGSPVDVPTATNGITPLCMAIDASCAEVALFLLSHAANPNKGDLRGRMPLHYAAKRAQAEIAMALIHSGAHADTTDVRGARRRREENGFRRDGGRGMRRGCSACSCTWEGLRCILQHRLILWLLHGS
jgi:ankyrin repeat protein